MEETFSIGEIENEEIEPRIPDFQDTLNYCVTHLFPDIEKVQREIKINAWLSGNKNRKQILERCVERCLRARDEAASSLSSDLKRMKIADEKATREHIERLIEYDYESYTQ